MAKKEISFSPHKAVESLLYAVARLIEPTVHEALKIRYFADKLHLAKYGWLASGDEYVAMQFGPVASSTYNLIKAARGDQSGWIHPLFNELLKDTLSVGTDGKLLQAHRKANLTLLVASDVECLDEAIRQYGGMPFNKRTDLSHDQAWKEAYAVAANDEVGASPMRIEAIAKTLDNADEVIAYLKH
jgi:uncharacterized phage-associated protein